MGRNYERNYGLNTINQKPPQMCNPKEETLDSEQTNLQNKKNLKPI